ncbi:MAG: carbohydrate-binding protein [Clostridia bacterium]|nr:carbohydrate-binding protein [Clostridia bacterium]
MRKRLIALLLAAIMVLSTTSAFAVHQEVIYQLTQDYWYGEHQRTITASKVIETNNADVSGDVVTINEGGNATWGFYLPWGARSVKIDHEGTAHIKMTSGENTYEFDLTGVNDGTANLLVFGENIGRKWQWIPQYAKGSAGYQKEWVETGELEITITADKTVTINSLEFDKEKLPGPSPQKINNKIQDYIITPEITDQELQTMSSVLMDTQANIIVVNGGRRYIDNNDTAMIPYDYNGSIYLPINTLAKALGYYYEDDQSKGYVLMRSNSHEYVLMDGKATIQEGYGAKQDAPVEAIIYRDGKTLAGVRYFAELTGDTVGYKDGLVAIDNKYTVNDILNNKTLNSYATGKFKNFKQERKVGNTYYVAQTDNASDDNTGNILAPIRTLAEAGRRAQAGDTVIVKEGTYREVLTPQNSGTPDAPITFKAAEGEEVIISAAESVGTIVKSKEDHVSGYDIYTAGLPETLGIGRDQIYVNGELMTQARYPNGPNLLEDGSMSNAWPTKGNIYYVAGTTGTFQSESLLNQEEEDYWKGAIYFGTFSNNYAHVSSLVKSSSYGNLEMDEKYYAKWWWESWTSTFKNQGDRNTQNYGCLIGHEHALDIPGEWVRTNDDILRIILPEGTDPKTAQVEAKARQRVVNLDNKKYVNVEGFKTLGGSATMNRSEMCMLNGMDMKYIAHYYLSADQRSGYIDFPYSRDDKNGAPQRGEVGLYVHGTDNIIVNSSIDHSAGCGIYLTGLYTYIENNKIADCGYTSSYTSGIHADTLFSDKAGTARGGYAIYNNELYNTGRNGIDFCVKEETATGSESHRSAIFRPSEIAYNDLYDLGMFTEDGGVVYANGCVVSFDEQRTEVHHNYVYTTKEPDVTWNFGIYWDGNAHGFDTHNNLIFSKTPRGTITYEDLNRHIVVDAGPDSTGRFWNNMELGYVGVDAAGLSEYHFPEEKMFYAGTKDSERQIMNYDRIKSGEAEMKNKAMNAKLSDSAMSVGSDGFVEFTEAGQYVLFENVDFGDGANQIDVYFRGDWNYTADKFKVYIGDTKETAHAYNLTAYTEGYGEDDSTTQSFVIGEVSGRKNVWIEAVESHSARLGGFSAWKHLDSNKTDEYTFFRYASTLDESIGQNRDFMAYSAGGGGIWPVAASTKSTYTGNTAIYKDCVVEEDSAYLAVAAGSRDNYLGQILDFYIDDETEPIASFDVRNRSFYDQMTADAIPLNRILKAGTYDIRIEFKGMYETVTKNADGTDNISYSKKTSNFNWFGFLKDDDGVSNLYVSRHQGGWFSKEESVMDANLPFHKLRDTGKEGNKMIVACTLPGTTAVYNDVIVDADSKRFVIEYSALEGDANQEIEVRVDDPNGEPLATVITEETGGYIYKTASVDLTEVVPKGKHKVYLSFGGDKENQQTCRISWFGFAKEACAEN